MHLRADRISKLYGENKAVNNVSLDLHPNQIYLLTGRSGSGKTTFLSMLSGILKPTSGVITIDDKSLYERSANDLVDFRKRHFGIVPQGMSLIESLSVKQNILLPSIDLDVDEEYVDHIMTELQIKEYADKMPNMISGGEARRAAIARALVNKPECIFADEPTSDLDSYYTKVVLELFMDLATKGTTIFMISHDSLVYSYTDNLLVMEDGSIHFD